MSSLALESCVALILLPWRLRLLQRRQRRRHRRYSWSHWRVWSCLTLSSWRLTWSACASCASLPAQSAQHTHTCHASLGAEGGGGGNRPWGTWLWQESSRFCTVTWLQQLPPWSHSCEASPLQTQHAFAARVCTQTKGNVLVSTGWLWWLWVCGIALLAAVWQ